MTWALAALQLVLAGTFFLAAVGKMLRSDEFMSALRLSRLPEWLVRVPAVIVPVLEIGTGMWLLLADPGSTAPAFAVALGLLGLFTCWMFWVRARRLRVRCGCFGPNGGEVGLPTIGRNLGLIALAGLGWLLSLSTLSVLPGPSPLMAAIALGLGLSIALLSALRFAWPHLTLTDDRLRVGGAAGE
jgi:hypothetical protein